MENKEITNEELLKTINTSFTELEGKMATKDDLAELEGKMATKDDLAELEGKMATKDDLAELEGKMATKGDLAVIREEMKELKRDMTTKEDVNKILTAVDGIKKKINDHDADRAANLEAHNRIQGDVNEVREHVGIKIKHPVLKPENS